MPRQLHFTEPEILNYVADTTTTKNYLEVATTNKHKLSEFQRILTDYKIVGKKLDIEEIQSMDPIKVVSHKAKEAWKANNYNPIVVEDTSLEIMGLSGRPGTYINDFGSDIEMRRMIVEIWLKGKDRRAVARVIIAAYDGIEVHTREGRISGTISEVLRGTNGFGWDDIFIPEGQEKTFAEMTDKQKDKYSMRAMALQKLKKKPFRVGYPILKIPEPYNSELERVREEELQDPKALRFAYSLATLNGINKPNQGLKAEQYHTVKREDNLFYSRFINNLSSPSLGLLLTDVDRSNIKLYKNGNPVIWQMGPERRSLAIAQRAEYFLNNHNEDVYAAIDKVEKEGIVERTNKKISAIEAALGLKNNGDFTNTLALKEIGYKKISAEKEVSRSKISATGLFSKIGKHPRMVYAVGSMPPVSGWRDVLVTTAIGHMAIFTNRNSLFAADPQKQIDLIKESKEVISSFKLPKKREEQVLRNIGAAVGAGNIKEEIAHAKKLFKEAGVKLFRIYTINGDPRVVGMARALRDQFGDEVEVFAGQVSDKEQCLQLISPDIRVDALVFGHGGGRQCTSATNGMAVTTLEEVYSIITDKRFNDTTLLVEGGVGTNVGGLLLLGIDGIIYNQQFTKGVIETGDLFFEHLNGQLCHPYHGSASAPTMLIESSNPKLMQKRIHASGRAQKVEGKPGYKFFSEKANTMAFHIDNFKHLAARTLADIGSESINEMREFLLKDDRDLLRIVSTEAKSTGEAYLQSR